MPAFILQAEPENTKAANVLRHSTILPWGSFNACHFWYLTADRLFASPLYDVMGLTALQTFYIIDEMCDDSLAETNISIIGIHKFIFSQDSKYLIQQL